MAIGKRIKYFRNRRGYTQKQFGAMLGFRSNTTDVRVAQYESESRIPKQDLLKRMAYYLGVTPEAIAVPNIDTAVGTMQTLFTLEDMGCFHIEEDDNGLCLRLNTDPKGAWLDPGNDLRPWLEEYTRYRNGDCTKEEYDDWRYKFPRSEAEKSAVQIREKRKEIRDGQTGPCCTGLYERTEE